MSPVQPSKSGKYLTSEEWDAMKAVGYSEAELQADQPLGPMVFSYTRAQAIDDGVLIDVTPIAQKVGFKLHTVVTCGVVAELSAGQPEDFNRFEAVYWLLLDLMKAIKLSLRKGESDRVDFKHTVGGTNAELSLYALVGPGDDGEAVLTCMLIGED